MELKNPSKEEQEDIDADRKLTHVAIFIDEPILDEAAVEVKIEDGLGDLNRRALAAGMIITQTTFLQSSHAQNGEGHVCITVLCQWMTRETMERLQTQQRFMGGTNLDGKGRPR